MCCTTHHDRDLRDLDAGVEIPYAEREEFRCQCKYGLGCQRRVTAEDFRCDWCRAVGGEDSITHADRTSGHYRECEEMWQARNPGVMVSPAGITAPVPGSSARLTP